MRHSSLWAIIAASVLGNASPIEKVTAAKLFARDPCDGVNASPILYHEYREDDCPAKLKLNPDGTCRGLDPDANGCIAFCQIRTNFVYDVEVPFDNSYCHGPFTCTITHTDTVTYSFSGSVNAKFIEAFGFGASGGYSQASATANARAYSLKLDDGACGYFTFVPVRKETCGSMSSAPARSFFSPGGVVTSRCDFDHEDTMGNFCGSEAKRNPGGSPDGETIFVKTDCNTRQPLDASQQDPVYQKPGVPLDRGVLANMINGWATSVPKVHDCESDAIQNAKGPGC